MTHPNQQASVRALISDWPPGYLFVSRRTDVWLEAHAKAFQSGASLPDCQRAADAAESDFITRCLWAEPMPSGTECVLVAAYAGSHVENSNGLRVPPPLADGHGACTPWDVNKKLVTPWA